ncbi:circadian clock KaiB family protein [Crocosphaera sp. UHCC 0190]|uniref:circadian clock KaiB family protein n=1 Tax=Crocosphaera sp. UHCC 0190 TaxID=3110246 RepID=UPI002B20BCA3|nr:circadian clock KaiB family protein [Crocosphaera sp. UHCC 0190]MEA5510137.1 circadian clock KaiB family protein [Crocosphaera sp. UHCC 0190]
MTNVSETPGVLPEFFKGIALFTPGGDMVYCLDSSKQIHWHSQLCLVLQELLKLPEPPHFLVPGYTATIDRWFCTREKTVKTVAELYPAVRRYQPLLNVLFNTPDVHWQTAHWQEEACNPIIIETYRSRFSELWNSHDLLIRLDERWEQEIKSQFTITEPHEDIGTEEHQGYILRLFVSGNNASTKHTLKVLHQLLETDLQQPYTLKVIDICKYPELAENNQISATPTLVRVWPKPAKRIVGELTDLTRVLQIITSN